VARFFRMPARRTIRLQATRGETQHLNVSSRTRVGGTGVADHLIIVVVVLLLFRAKCIGYLPVWWPNFELLRGPPNPRDYVR
jgi:hypothetical protein